MGLPPSLAAIAISQFLVGGHKGMGSPPSLAATVASSKAATKTNWVTFLINFLLKVDRAENGQTVRIGFYPDGIQENH